jgi:hypothetical protein
MKLLTMELFGLPIVDFSLDEEPGYVSYQKSERQQEHIGLLGKADHDVLVFFQVVNCAPFVFGKLAND